MVWLFAMATPAFVVLLIAATWAIVDGPRSIGAKAIGLAFVWPIFLGLLIVPECWYLQRIWRRIPAVQVDAQGILWGNDWSRDAGLRWNQIARIRSRLQPNRYYTERLLLFEPKSPTIPRHFSRVARLATNLNLILYGTPFVLGFKTLRIRPEDLIDLIRRRYDGVIDLTGIE